MKEMIARVGDSINKDGIASVCLTGEELVRCKDCKYDPSNAYPREELPYWYPCKNGMRDQDWFCAYGKRKENDFWDSLSEADLMEPMHHFND